MEWITSLVTPQMLQSVLHSIGYPAVTLFILIESAGIPLPGEMMILFASFLAASDPTMQLPIIIACAAFGAIVGDNIGYYIGRTGGRAFIERFGRFFFVKTAHLDKAERFFAKHGAKTVFLGRFITLLRIWAAFLAGVNKMPWRTFMLYNSLGGIVWATYIGLIGYFSGRLLHDHFEQVAHLVATIGWVGLVVVIAGAIVGIVIYHIRKRHRIHAAETSPEKVSDEHSRHSLEENQYV